MIRQGGVRPEKEGEDTREKTLREGEFSVGEVHDAEKKTRNKYPPEKNGKETGKKSKGPLNS